MMLLLQTDLCSFKENFKNYFIFTCVFTIFNAFHSFPKIDISIWSDLLSIKRFPLVSLVNCCCWQKSLDCFYFENVFLCPCLYGTNLINIEFDADSCSFFFKTLKKLLQSLLVSLVSSEKSVTVPNLFLLPTKCLSLLFYRFSCSIVSTSNCFSSRSSLFFMRIRL